jgi:excisionase family DNA binding protein
MGGGRLSLADIEAHNRQFRRSLQLVSCYMDASTGQRWLSPLQFAVTFGLSRRTVYEMVRRGQLTTIRLGRQLRIAEPTTVYGPPAPPEDLRMLLSCEVAGLLGVQPQSVRKLARRHRIGYRMISGRRLYSLSDVRRVLAARALGRRRLRPGQSVHEGMVNWARNKLAALQGDLARFGLQEAEGDGTLPATLGGTIGGAEVDPAEALRACWAALGRMLTTGPVQAKAIPRTPSNNGPGGLPIGSERETEGA